MRTNSEFQKNLDRVSMVKDHVSKQREALRSEWRSLNWIEDVVLALEHVNKELATLRKQQKAKSQKARKNWISKGGKE